MKTQPNTQVICRHHWLLGQPSEGAISGVCRNCGTRRRFPAAVDETRWENDLDDSALGDVLQATAAGGVRPSPGYDQ
jgi:hypothetical protein